MSFFTYYGKLKGELIVAILPNGTVELDDPIQLYTQKQFMSYRARAVSVTEDGEDLITFHDGYYSFEVVSSKAYKSLSLARKTISSDETTNVELTRHYDQPQTGASLTDRPKIWTGTFSFHQWAENEAFVIVAPQGVGNGKPVVTMWQWTKDNKGTQKTLSYGTSKQAFESAEKFSFKQNDYYTLDCQINAATNGLNVTVKAPTNADKVQKELALAHQTDFGAEHRFAPPRARQEKIALECSLPNAKPSLPRITGALPFPADLVETLSYSAAYVDQAGYLAKYAVKQFEKLDRSYHLLEKKAEARALKVTKLEGEVSRLTTENEGLTKRNDDLEKQMVENRKEAEKRESTLEERLRKTLAALHASEGRQKKFEAENKTLRKHIAEDLIEDMEREQKHKEHDKADHKAIDLANEALRDAQDVGKRLQKELECKDKIIAQLQASLDATVCQLEGAEAEISRLKGELAVEKKEKAEVKEKLDAALHKLDVAEQDLKHLRTEVANVKADVAAERKANNELQKKLDGAQSDLTKAKEAAKQANSDLADLQKKYDELSQQNESTWNALKETKDRAKEAAEQADSDLADLQKKYDELSQENDSTWNTLKETKDRANLSDKGQKDAINRLNQLRIRFEAMETLKNEWEARAARVTSDTISKVKSDMKATVAEVTTT